MFHNRTSPSPKLLRHTRVSIALEAKRLFAEPRDCYRGRTPSTRSYPAGQNSECQPSASKLLLPFSKYLLAVRDPMLNSRLPSRCSIASSCREILTRREDFQAAWQIREAVPDAGGEPDGGRSRQRPLREALKLTIRFSLTLAQIRPRSSASSALARELLA